MAKERDEHLVRRAERIFAQMDSFTTGAHEAGHYPNPLDHTANSDCEVCVIAMRFREALDGIRLRMPRG